MFKQKVSWQNNWLLFIDMSVLTAFIVHASDLQMLLRGFWSGEMLVLIPGRLELENGQSGKPWFEDHNIEQSSSARQTANDDDNLFLGL